MEQAVGRARCHGRRGLALAQGGAAPDLGDVDLSVSNHVRTRDRTRAARQGCGNASPFTKHQRVPQIELIQLSFVIGLRLWSGSRSGASARRTRMLVAYNLKGYRTIDGKGTTG